MSTTISVVVQIPDGDVLPTRDLITLADALRRTALEHAPGATALTQIMPSTSASPVVIDLPARQVLVDGIDADLSFSEFEVLAQLVRRPRSVVERSNLLSPEATHAEGRRIDVHVSRIRAKLGRWSTVIGTVRGVGYRFDPDRRVRVIDLPAVESQNAVESQDATARLTA